MKKIQGLAKTIRQLLSGTKYAIDYYQREYRWQAKQVAELIDDLTDKFLEDFQPGHERTAVQGYGHYFLGSIIVSEKGELKFIVDGQQRLTTLTLLLIFLHNRHPDSEDKAVLQEMIFSRVHGRRSFNIDVDERTPCMDALFRSQHYDTADQSDSVRNILGRYRDIEDHFPNEISDAVLPHFVDWVTENVHLVEITAYSDEDAYTIFETMNDRGLSLTPTEMLKGYVLANITDTDRRQEANRTWKDRVGDLTQLGKDVSVRRTAFFPPVLPSVVFHRGRASWRRGNGIRCWSVSGGSGWRRGRRADGMSVRFVGGTDCGRPRFVSGSGNCTGAMRRRRRRNRRSRRSCR